MPDERWLIRNPANGRAVMVRQIESPLFVRRPMIFRELQRWRRPWWARAIAWGIALYYVRGSRRG